MTLIITVEDSFLLPDKGVVVSGVNPLLDHEDRDSIKLLIGERVRICRDGEDDFFVDVLDFGFSESLIGKKNISILLADTGFGMIDRGVGVFVA